MRLRIINPNTTASMTRKIGDGRPRRGARGHGSHGRQPRIRPRQHRGLLRRGVFAARPARRNRQGPRRDAFVIACFDDTGLEAARCATEAPVIGIGEAAFHMASLIAEKFSVVTTLSRSIVPIERNLQQIRPDRALRPRARRRSAGAGAGRRGLRRAPADRGGDRAGRWRRTGRRPSCSAAPAWPTLRTRWRDKFGVPVLDGVACAVALAESAAAAGLAHLEAQHLRRAARQSYAGAFARFAPR